jgi:hypothetical protein
MISKQLLVYFLVISLLPLTINSPSQVSTSLTTVATSSTLTSYSTYTVGMTQVTSTVANTIFKGDLPLPGWTAGGCTFTTFPFNTNPGDQLALSFVSDVPLDFYFMSVSQFQRVPPSTTLCTLGFIPIFPSLYHASYQTTYSFSWTAPDSGQYYILLFDLQAASAGVLFSAIVTSLQTGPVAISGTGTTTITNVNSQTLSTFVTAQSSTAASEGLQAQNVQWIVAAIILVALGVTFLVTRRKRPPKMT